MTTVFAIDGRQLCSDVSGGVQRFIFEMVRELDKIVPRDTFEIIIPQNCDLPWNYENIRIVKYGHLNGLLWEQLDFPRYLITKKRKGIFMCSITSMLYPHHIVFVHDIMPVVVPEIGQAISNILMRYMLFLNYRIACKRADYLVTASRNSLEDISRVYKRDPKTINIIPNGWQHISRIDSDDSWTDLYPAVKKGEYFFSLSANRKQKNFVWIYEVAKRHPDKTFLIAGTVEEWQKNATYTLPNIINLGYVSDGIVKSLMENCRAFLFPSFYEGFGIPPIEALACGAQIIIANASCLPDIYRDSAHYIDPFNYDVDLEEILKQPVAPASSCLDRFGWDKSAKLLLELCEKLIVDSSK